LEERPPINMKRIEPTGEPPKRSGARTVFLGFVGAALLLLLLGLILSGPTRSTFDSPRNRIPVGSVEPSTYSKNSTRPPPSPRWRNSASPQTAEEIVATKVSLFGKKRRELVHAMARKFNIDVPSDVERFFEAVESGR